MKYNIWLHVEAVPEAKDRPEGDPLEPYSIDDEFMPIKLVNEAGLETVEIAWKGIEKNPRWVGWLAMLNNG